MDRIDDAAVDLVDAQLLEVSNNGERGCKVFPDRDENPVQILEAEFFEGLAVGGVRDNGEVNGRLHFVDDLFIAVRSDHLVALGAEFNGKSRAKLAQSDNGEFHSYSTMMRSLGRRR